MGGKKAPREQIDHIIAHDATCGADAYACECLTCGAKLRFALPIAVERYVAALKKFQRAHAGCADSAAAVESVENPPVENPPVAYDSGPATRQHIDQVRGQIDRFITALRVRALDHDLSKLGAPEKAVFDRFTPMLAGLTYGSAAYFETLGKMKPALDHHYRSNRHHPEHHRAGVQDMGLVDLIEMLCDWYAACQRHRDGNFAKSLAINAKRFAIAGPVYELLVNTAVAMDWILPPDTVATEDGHEPPRAG